MMGDLISLKRDIVFFQTLLKAAGVYAGKTDGVNGPQTIAAEKAFTAETESIKCRLGTADETSEKNISTLIPAAQTAARTFLAICKQQGKQVQIISGTRSFTEQNRLYAQGRRGNTLPRVTNARGGQSNHNFGIAFDIGIFNVGKYVTAENEYRRLAADILPQIRGLDWGGNWLRFPDLPHYQLPTVSENMAIIKTLFQNGRPYIKTAC